MKGLIPHRLTRQLLISVLPLMIWAQVQAQMASTPPSLGERAAEGHSQQPGAVSSNPGDLNSQRAVQSGPEVGNSAQNSSPRDSIETHLGRAAKSLSSVALSELNALEYRSPELTERLRQLWKSASERQVVIAHYGDSHVQGGPAVQVARSLLQGLAGSAGRGMIFPYAAAKTYDQVDFRSSFSGSWVHASSIQTSPRLKLGVSGFAAHTSDALATFGFKFNRAFDPGVKVVRLFYRVRSAGYKLTVQSGEIRQTIDLPLPDGAEGTQLAELLWPSLGDDLQFEIQNEDASTRLFELYGVSIENLTPGILYHNLGVGGATFGSLLAQDHFVAQSRELNPDIVILDWGTNDIAYKNEVPDKFEETVLRTLERIRSIHPQALIILTSAQDMYMRRRAITAAETLSVTLRRIAMNHHCFFYDWYRIAGGADSMRTFYAYGMANPDHIHLSPRGYALKGHLFAQALINTLSPDFKGPIRTSPDQPYSGKEHPLSVAAWLKNHTELTRRPDLIALQASPPSKSKKSAKARKNSAKKQSSSEVKKRATMKKGVTKSQRPSR